MMEVEMRRWEEIKLYLGSALMISLLFYLYSLGGLSGLLR